MRREDHPVDVLVNPNIASSPHLEISVISREIPCVAVA